MDAAVCDPVPGLLLIGGAAFAWWVLRSTWRDIVGMKDRQRKASAAARIRQMPPEQLIGERYEDLVAEEARLCRLMQHRWANDSTATRLAQIQAAIMQQLVGPVQSCPAIETPPKPMLATLKPVPLARKSTALAIAQRGREVVRRKNEQ